MKLVYIAGSLTHPDPAVVAARRARALVVGTQVEAAGRYVAFVPHAHILDPRLDTPDEIWRECMKKCIAVLRRCDRILLLDGWEKSRGARIEVWLCRRRSGFPKIATSLESLVMEDLDA